MWLKCKAMQDVEVKLPPGLAPNMVLCIKINYLIYIKRFIFIIYILKYLNILNIFILETSSKSG